MSAENSDPTSPEALWSAGLPFCSQRPLTVDEHHRIEGLQRRLQVLGTLQFGAGPGLFLTSVFVWLSNPSAESSWQFLAAGVFLGLLILGLGVSPGGWALLKEARTLRNSLQLGVADRFGRPVEDDRPPELPEVGTDRELDEEDLEVLEEAEPVVRTPRVELELGGRTVSLAWLEILHGSGLILAANARLPKGRHYAPGVAVAAVPEYAAIAAEWVEPLDSSDPRSPLLNRRALTPAEAAEIAALRRGLLKMPGTLVTLGALVMGFVVSANASSVPQNAWNDGIGFPLILLAFGGVALVRDYLRYRVLRQDEAAGMVLILRIPERGPETPGEPPVLSPVIELLPFSRFVWTQGGRPAPWRST